MKAVRLQSPGKPLKLVEVDDPEPGPGEIVVKISSSGVCHSDLHIANGEFASVKYPITLGHEPAGTIHDVGDAVKDLKKGQTVLVYPGSGCGRCWFCFQGEENHCESGRFFGFDQDGAYAEYLLVESPHYLLPIPGLSTDEAAPLACAGITAYHAVKAKALPVLHPDDCVVIIGVGGLGHIAIQLLKKFSTCPIVAVDVRRQSLLLAEKLGADHTMLAGKDLARQVRKVAKKGVGAVIDFVGSTPTLTASYAMLRACGRVVAVGATGGSLRMDAGSTNGREVHGSILGSRSEMQELIELATRKQFKVIVQAYPLEQVNEVLKMVENGRVTGRAVLKP
jgi:D-arabinose 1-dehydrogenase-like Zn-dependent alcohol dehydrogenase